MRGEKIQTRKALDWIVEMVEDSLNLRARQALSPDQPGGQTENVWGKCKMLAAALFLSGCLHNPPPASDTLMKAREALETAIAIIDATENDQ